MIEQSATSSRAAIVRRQLEAVNRRDVETRSSSAFSSAASARA
jgi:hypothetical protein